MRTKTSVLVVAGLASLVAGARAADQSGPVGNVLFPVGDKVHGYLRGGETHAMQVHLAKGDVYSSTYSAKGVNDLLLMHVAVIDPAGRDVSMDARVKHFGLGKRVTVGPFRAAKSGTYSVLVSGQGLWEGAYSGKSKLHGARRSTMELPTNGSTVDVAVAAGSSIRVRSKGKVTSLVLAMPQEAAQTFGAADPILGSMLASRGLPTSESGTFRLGAVAGQSVKVEVTKPKWKSSLVVVKALPDDPTRQASFQWILDWVNEATIAPTTTPTPLATDPPVLSAPASGYGGLTSGTGAPVPVDSPVSHGATATLFVGGALDAAGAFPLHVHPVDPVTGAVAVPPATTPPETTPPETTPPVTTPPATTPPAPPVFGSEDLKDVPRTVSGSGYYMVGVPTMSCSQLVGRSQMFSLYSGIYTSGMRDTPWTRSTVSKYPASIVNALAPMQSLSGAYYYSAAGTKTITENADQQRGDQSDPFVRRTFQISQSVSHQVPVPIGTITTTARYFVDDHQVDSLLAGKGEYTIKWDVSAAGSEGAPWKVEGAWTLTMHLPDLSIKGTKASAMACILSGKETFTSGSLTETVSTDALTLHPMNYYYDVTGSLTNKLSDPAAGLTQTLTRSFLPSTFPWANNTLDRYKPVETKMTDRKSVV